MEHKKMVDTEGFVKWFSELSNEDISIAGGKGASLAEMFNNNFPVPAGFIITAQAFDYFIKQNSLKERINKMILKMNMEDTQELEKASKDIRQMVEEQEIPHELESEILEAYHILGSEKISSGIGVSQDALNILKNSQEPVFVAVRSSATTEDLGAASFAGAGESFVNTKGDRQILWNVKKCFSSLYTARAIYYRKKQGFGVDKVDSLLAVVVQKMVDSEKSGVVFSRDPINFNDDIIIEAVFGLGEGIVSGAINPDNYVVSRDLKIKDIKLGNKKIAIVRSGSGENSIVKLNSERAKSQVLTNNEIIRLGTYALKLEEHYKKPQDIEFAVEAGKVYIVQSRPITTLNEKKKASGNISGNIILSGQGASPGVGVGIVRLIKSMDDLSKIKKGDVLVTEMTNPDMVVAMQKSVAIITDEGGMTSHAAIVSREMGIPAIVGTGNATSVLQDGMKVTVDAYNGKVYEGQVSENKFVEIKPAVETNKVKLKLILDLPDFAQRAAESKLDSVGLLRLEGIIAESGKHPLQYEKENNMEEYVNVLVKGIGKIAEHFNSIWIRSSDIRTDEFGDLKGAPEKEINPMLGFHGIRFSLKHPKIFEAELLAIARVAEKNPDKNFGVMFPQIISSEEVRRAKEFFNKYKKENMEFGVMIETPAAVQVIEDICKEGVNFISFGTNDLTQFTLAIDRGNEDVQYLYNELDAAIFSEIKRVLWICRKYNVQTSICGQAGSKKEMVEFLFPRGINSISVNADAAYETSLLIKKLDDEWIARGEEMRKEREERQKNQQQRGQQNWKNENRKFNNNFRNKNFDKRNQNNNNNRFQKNNEAFKRDNESRPGLFEDKRGELGLGFEEKKVNSENKNNNADNKTNWDFSKVDNSCGIYPQQKNKEVKKFEEDIGAVMPVDNLNNVEKKAEEIHEEVRAKNDWLLKRNEEAEDNIEVEREKVDEVSSSEDEDSKGAEDVSSDEYYTSLGEKNPEETKKLSEVTGEAAEDIINESDDESFEEDSNGETSSEEKKDDYQEYEGYWR